MEPLNEKDLMPPVQRNFGNKLVKAVVKARFINFLTLPSWSNLLVDVRCGSLVLVELLQVVLILL